jgi:hypothetical protein
VSLIPSSGSNLHWQQREHNLANKGSFQRALLPVVVSSQPTGCRCSHQTNRRATTHDASSRWPLPRTVRWACWHGLPTAISSLSRSARLGQRRLAPSPSIWQATLRCGTTATDAYGPSPWPQIHSCQKFGSCGSRNGIAGRGSTSQRTRVDKGYASPVR